MIDYITELFKKEKVEINVEKVEEAWRRDRLTHESLYYPNVSALVSGCVIPELYPAQNVYADTYRKYCDGCGARLEFNKCKYCGDT